MINVDNLMKDEEILIKKGVKGFSAEGYVKFDQDEIGIISFIDSNKKRALVYLPHPIHRLLRYNIKDLEECEEYTLD